MLYNAVKKSLSFLRPRSEGLPPFTEYYCDRLDKDFEKEGAKGVKWNPSHRRKSVDGVPHVSPPVPKLSRSERLLGWRSVKLSNFPEDNFDTQSTEKHWKVKTWMSNGTSRGVKHVKGQLKKTWEVCQESAPSTYRMLKHEKYAVIAELRNERVTLHTEGETVDNDFVFEREQEETTSEQNNDDIGEYSTPLSANNYQVSSYPDADDTNENTENTTIPKSMYDVSSSDEEIPQA